MMNIIKEQTRYYLIFSELKSNIKAEECGQKDLKTDLEKLQKKVFELSSSVDALKWKIKRAKLIFSCEKMRHNFFYNIIETTESITTKNCLLRSCNRLGMNFGDYKAHLEKEKAALVKQLEKLKE